MVGAVSIPTCTRSFGNKRPQSSVMRSFRSVPGISEEETPHRPGDQAGDIDAEHVGDAAAPADHRYLAELPEDERLFVAAADRCLYVLGEDLRLGLRVLGGRRIERPARSDRD